MYQGLPATFFSMTVSQFYHSYCDKNTDLYLFALFVLVRKVTPDKVLEGVKGLGVKSSKPLLQSKRKKSYRQFWSKLQSKPTFNSKVDVSIMRAGHKL